MTSNWLFLIINIQLLTGFTVFAGRNYEYDIKASCYNSHTGAMDSDCYPFWYEGADGTPNVFCDFIAVLNYINPLISLGGIKLNHSLIKRYNKKINYYIDQELVGIKNGEMHIRDLLAEIIKKFDNGINTGVDQDIASSLIEKLNLHKCENCIKKFVAIVSKNAEEIEPISANPTEFYNLADAMRKPHHETCDDYQELSHSLPSKPNLLKRTANMCCYSWNHPFHISSLAYVAAALAIPPCLGIVVDKNNRAGSLAGDIANFSNMLVIPTIHAYTMFQNWRNYDRIKTQRLLNEIQQRLEGINGIIEIAARVIGTMDNNINIIQARGFLKILIIIGWPQDLVELFIQLASGQIDDFNNFINTLKNIYNNHTYKDEDIEAAFNLPSSSAETKVEEVFVEIELS